MCWIHHEKRWTGWSTGWSQIAGRNTNNLRYTDDTTLNGRKWRGTKEPLDEWKMRVKKAGFKLNIQKWRWWYQVPSLHGRSGNSGSSANSERLFFLGSKLTADGGCSHEIKKYLLFGRKAVTTLDSILKSRDISWPTKVHVVKVMVFPVVMYRCETWTIKKAEC